MLEYLLCLNTHAALTYTLGFGDKDTFRAAFALAGAAADFQQVCAAGIPVLPTEAQCA